MNLKKQNPIKRILSIKGMGGAITAFVGLVIIYVAFGIINPTVFSGQNIMNLLRSMSKYLLIGIGQSYLLITGNIDLSIGSVVAMSAMISATLMTQGVNPLVAILITLLCCLVVGVVNGFLVGKCQLPPFIATMGTMFVARGVAYIVNGNRNTDAIASGIGKEAGESFQNFFYYGKTFGVYNTFWIAIILFVIFFFLLSKTRTGRHIYAIGSNVEAAKLSGVSVLATTTKAYLVSAFCSFVVGLILCAQAGMGNMEATCGAMIGAAMIVGLKTEGNGAVMATKKIQEEFRRRCGALKCRDLKAITDGKPLCPCDECVRNAVLIYGEVMGL